MKKKKIIIIATISLLITAVLVLADYFELIPHKTYDDAHFGIETYQSTHDQDGDGVDDQTDILNSVREYLETEPQYKSQYYATGYPDDNYGVCTDVVAFGLRGAGYDLMELVNEDVLANRDLYDISTVDKKIDFRRVKNLQVWFSRHAISLTTDPNEIDQWQGGDIVVFEHHVGVVSDKRNKQGVSYVLHNGSPLQNSYEQDILDHYGTIVGHYRIS